MGLLYLYLYHLRRFSLLAVPGYPKVLAEMNLCCHLLVSGCCYFPCFGNVVRHIKLKWQFAAELCAQAARCPFLR